MAGVEAKPLKKVNKPYKIGWKVVLLVGLNKGVGCYLNTELYFMQSFYVYLD